MEIKTYGSVTAMVYLTKEEGWTVYNDKNRPFKIWSIQYTGSRDVALSGWAILKDGSEGSTRRYGRLNLRSLPIHLSAQIVAAHNDRLVELLDKAEL